MYITRLALLNSKSKKVVERKSPKLGFGISLILLLFIPLVILLSLELLYTGSLLSVIKWIKGYFNEFILNYVIMFALTNIFYILPRRFYLVCSGILLTLFSTLGYISHEELIIKGSPLVPSDLFLVKEAIGISSKFQGVFIVVGAIVLICLLLVVLLLKFVPKEKYRLPLKLGISLLSTLLLFSIYSYFHPIEKGLALEVINYSQKVNYAQNGMMLGFIMNAESQKSEIPADYQQSVINNIVENNKASYTVDSNFKPNIIFVMSEAFWDPTLMRNVEFSEDPIPFFHSLQKTQTSGTMLSEVYGGGTANTEFEIMTGFSAQFLPAGTIAYSQYINRPIEALPMILSRQGYAASAIHTYDNWFYDRNIVYKKFGFDKFISKEFLNQPEYHGSYIRDTELTSQILKEVNETSSQDFIYSVSMENHGPYSSEENSNNTIKVTGANLTKESQAILENYTNSINDVDKSLQQLIEGLEKIDEPTLVVFFGDHLPLLGDDYSVYKDAGFITDGNSYEDYINLHSVPFVIWNNFGAEVKHDIRVSANYMGTLALQMAKKSGSPMTDYLSMLLNEGSDAVINPAYQSQEKMSSKQINDYKNLQYDLLFGNEFTYELKPDHKPVANDKYIQGDALPKITNVSFSGDTLIVQGENFVENDKIYINNKEVNTTYEGATSLTAASPNNKKITIQVKLVDSMDKVISESNIFTIDQ